MKKILIIGNWKTNPANFKEVRKLIKGVESAVKKTSVGYGYAVPDIYFNEVRELKPKGLLGVQNIGVVSQGAHTGRSSVGMYASSGVEFTILGHSEVRKEGETNQLVNEKLQATLGNKLLSIVCVGESERDNDGIYLKYIEDQLKQILFDIKPENSSKLVIAYEPLWAIGTGINASAEQCFEVIIMIRRTLATILGIEHAKKVLVLYGGSTNKQNAVEFIVEGSADGLLVGKSSLDEKEFGGIINNIYEAIR